MDSVQSHISNEDKELFLTLVRDGNLDRAVSYIMRYPPDDATIFLGLLESTRLNLLSYFLVFLIIQKEQKISWKEAALIVAEFFINYLPGGYSVAAYEARGMLELDKNLSHILFITFTPDGTFDACEAVAFAYQALQKDATNELALETLERFTKDGAICEHECMLKEQPDKALAFEWLIYQGKFPEAESMMPMLGEKGWQAQLLFLGAEQRNLGAYAFVLYLISKEERAALHYLAYRMITLGYPRGIYGSNIVGYYHITRAHELEPDSLTYMEHIFLLYQESDETKRLIGKDRVTAIAQKLSSRGWSFVANCLIKRDKATGSVTW